MIHFRQKWLSEEGLQAGFDTHDKGTLQLAMVWAAFANTIPSAFWALYGMVQSGSAPECEAEARRVLCSERDGEMEALLSPTLSPTSYVQHEESLATSIAEDLPVISAVVNEALRLCIASLTVRDAVEDIELPLKASGS